MIDISSFVLRWMFVSNLCRDISEIQTLPSINVLPSQPPSARPDNYPNDCSYYQQQQQLQQQQQQQQQLLPTDRHVLPQTQVTPNVVDNPTAHHHIDTLPPSYPTQQSNERQPPLHLYQTQQQQPQQPPQIQQHSTRHKQRDVETEYKEQCWRGLLSYPPNCVQRNMVINNLRTELVQQLRQRIRHDTLILQQYNMMNAKNSVQTTPSTDGHRRIEHEYITEIETKSTAENMIDVKDDSQAPSLKEYIIAKRSLLLFRNYLPQLVSVILKSPPPLTTTTTTTVIQEMSIDNPIQQLRHIVLSQCVHDASIGIELCWLLEAEIGRTWKTLFEHRQQQTGRRLIIVLPADKAIVLAKIGIEKRETFDLLQDVEQATAFGYTESSLLNSDHKNHHDFIEGSMMMSNNAMEHPTRLPSSLSVRRCSHFGDAMHFIDRLSKISSDLRMIPTPYRYNVLHDNLHELNRRLRRRMVSRGDISLDVDDNRGPYDWPHIEDMSLDLISHSVHLPLIPQIGTWCDGVNNKKNLPSEESLIPNTEVVRVLNIVVHESKLLSSRERCPFLIHVEVADSGLEGNDARLYSSGTSAVGSTIGEALGMINNGFGSNRSDPSTSPLNENHDNVSTKAPRNIIPYSIPDELLPHPIPTTGGFTTNEHSDEYREQNAFLRGGSQSESPYYDGHDVMTGEYMIDPFDLVRQQDYEQLHRHLLLQRTFESLSPAIPLTIQKVSVGGELLDNVFGREWRDKCKEIRDTSPYGHVKGWRLASFIMKAGEDIRRESFVMQIISKLQSWFQEEIPEADRPFMRPYTIMCVGGDAGLLECLSDAKSVDEVKKRTDDFTTLRDYFERAYGPPRRPAFISPSGIHNGYDKQMPLDPFGLSKIATGNNGHVSFETAQDNFLRSLVGYSLVCYILQIKDRHNANILLDRLGHIMHIDFGYVLGDTPKMGKVPIFSERAPFKLSSDFWDVLGGWNVGAGGLGVKFCKMFELAFQCASSHADEIAALTEAAVLSLHSNPRHARSLANGVRLRLRMRGTPGSREQKMFIMELVNAALTSWGTSTYDWLQRNMNGYQ